MILRIQRGGATSWTAVSREVDPSVVDLVRKVQSPFLRMDITLSSPKAQSKSLQSLGSSKQRLDDLRHMTHRLQRRIVRFLLAGHGKVSSRWSSKAQKKRKRGKERTSSSGSSNTIKHPAPWSRMPWNTLSRIIWLNLREAKWGERNSARKVRRRKERTWLPLRVRAA